MSNRILLSIFIWLALNSACLGNQIKNSFTSWKASKGQSKIMPKITLVSDSGVKNDVLKIDVRGKGKYQGVTLKLQTPFELSKYAKISFWAKIKQNKYYGPHTTIALTAPAKRVSLRQYFMLAHNKWTYIEVPFGLKNFAGYEKINWKKLAPITNIVIGKRTLQNPGEYLMLSGFKFHKRQSGFAKIKVLSYKYTQTVSNDPTLKELTNGKISSSKQAKWPAVLGGDPEIVFDLGHQYFVDEVKLDAFGKPNQNIANVVVFASENGKKWHQVANLVSDDESGKIKHQKFTLAKINSIGRYFKILLLRPRHDSSSTLAEVHFAGRIPTTDDYKKAMFKTYSVGPPMPTVNKKNYWVLKDKQFTAYISKKNGVLVNLTKNSQIFVARLLPQYIIEYSQKNKTVVDGYSDKVIKHTLKNNILTLTLTNSKIPGLMITRRIKLENEDLKRYTEFHYNKSVKAFISLGHKLTFPKQVRTDGVYESLAAMHSCKRIFASDVTGTMPIDDVPVLSFRSISANNIFWQHRVARNGKFQPLDSQITFSSKNTFITTNGWKMIDGVFTLDGKCGSSLETVLAMGGKGLFEVFKKYRESKKVKDFYAWIKRPSYINTVRCVAHVSNYEIQDEFENYVKLLRDGEILSPLLGGINFLWGDFPVKNDVRGDFGERRTPSQMRQFFADLQKRFPRGRFGLYTWLWSSMAKSQTYQNNPDWFIDKDDNGAALSFWPCKAPNFTRRSSIQASQDDMVNQITTMLERYKLDVWYLDGGQICTTKDWSRMTIDSPEGWIQTYKRIITQGRKNNPELLIFFNTPYQPFADIGFLENSGDAMTDWRISAPWMWKIKLLQLGYPGHYPSYIYWRPATNRLYPAYMAGLGLMPTMIQHALTQRETPFLSAQNEAKNCQMASTMITPDWRVDPKIELESFTLTQGKAGVVLLRSFEKKLKQYKLSLGLKGLGINDVNQPIYQYLVQCHRYVKWQGRLGERERENVYRQTGWMPDRYGIMNYIGQIGYQQKIHNNFKLHPITMYQWVVTQSPALIFSIDSLPLQIPRVDALGVKVFGKTFKDKIELTVSSTKKSAELMLAIPKDRTIATLKLAGADIKWRPMIMNGNLFAIVGIQTGNHKITCDLKNTSPDPEGIKIDAFKVNYPNEITLNIAGVKTDLCLQVELNAQVMWSRQISSSKVTVPLSKTLRKGQYELKLYALDGSLLAQKAFALPEGKSAVVIKRRIVPKQVFKEQAASCQGKGFTITKAASQYSKGCYNATFAPEKAAVTIASDPILKCVWITGCAGYKMNVKRFVKIKMSGNLHYFATRSLRRHSRWEWARDFFIGLTIDFQKKNGWTRSHLGFGAIKAKHASNTHFISGQKLQKAGNYMVSDFAYSNRKKETLWLDLKQYGAPKDWNGTIWLAPTLSIIAPDRKLTVQVLESTDKLPAGAVVARSLDLLNSHTKSAKIIELPIISQKVKIDARYSNSEWENSQALSGLTLLNNPITPASKSTVVRFMRDDKNLYIFYDCSENNVVGTSNSDVFKSDSVEFVIQIAGSKNKILHIIIAPDGNSYRKYEFLDRSHVAMNANIPKQFKTKINKGKNWTVEYAIPLTALGLNAKRKGMQLGFNIMRNRYSSSKIEYMTLAPGSSYFDLKQYKLKIK